MEIKELGLRTYVAEPDRGPRNWDGKTAERDAVYANRRRIHGERGKRLQAQLVGRRSSGTSRTSSMAAAWIGCIPRGRENVHKRLLVLAAACILALLLRSWYGAGKPKRPMTSSLPPFLRFSCSSNPSSQRPSSLKIDALDWGC